MNNTMKEIYRAIYAAMTERAHMIGNVIVAKAKKKILDDGPYDKGDFYRGVEYRVTRKGNSIGLAVGSNVAHEPFVLGGKVPSWTPLEPLKAWVERKKLDWVDKKTKKELTIDEMARIIQFKIKARGIEERNVFAEVIENEKEWIFDQLDSIEVVL